MIKIDDHCNVNLDTLAATYYGDLNPLNADGISYHATASVIGRILAQRADDASANIPIRVDFWDYLLHNNYANLKIILSGRPPDLKAIIDDVDNVFSNHIFSTQMSYETSILTEFGEIVKNVFKYDTLYRYKPKCPENCSQFKLAYCPYCNEATVSIIAITDLSTGQQRAMALHQLDHFYPQSRYPYLSLSFFNLVPGCSVCNSQLKGDRDFDIDTHFNPFQKRLDDYFIFSINTLIPNKPNEIIFDVSNKQPHPHNAIQDFRILERYNVFTHQKTIYNLLKTLKNHSPKIERSIWRQFADQFGIYQTQKNNLLQANSVPLQQDEINLFQLGKLKRDIVISMGFI